MLASVFRSTPRSPRDLEFTNLPSPRQLAVADAVKFGFSEGDSGAIPYIDEANTPEDQKVEKSKLFVIMYFIVSSV